MSRTAILRSLIILLIAAGVGAVIAHWSHFSVDALKSWIEDFGILAPLLFIAAYCLAAIFFMPASLFTLAAGALFGPVWGAVYSLGGGTLGAILAFLIARYVASEWIAAHAGPRVSRIIDGAAREGWRFVAVTRLIPIFPYAPLNYFFGLSRIPLLQFIAATFIFMAPATIAYSWLGHIGMEAASGRDNWVEIGLFGFAALALIAFLPRMIKYIRR